MKEQLVATRDAMLARHAHLFETALCHYMHGSLTVDDRGDLNRREKMRPLKQNPEFDPKNPIWPDLELARPQGRDHRRTEPDLTSLSSTLPAAHPFFQNGCLEKLKFPSENLCKSGIKSSKTSLIFHARLPMEIIRPYLETTPFTSFPSLNRWDSMVPYDYKVLRCRAEEREVKFNDR